MVFQKIMTVMLACLLLAGSLAGCGCQAEKPADQPSAPVLEADTTTPETTAAAPTTEPPAETAAPTETEAPTEEDSWLGEPTEDTRPPIEVPVPEGTQPYTDYEQYMDMSEEEQMKFYDSFESDQAFFDWFNAAKAEYEKAHPPVIIDGSTNIELKP